MFKWIRSKIGAKLLITFSLVLVVSMVSLLYIATQKIGEFGEFSAARNEMNIRENAKAFMTRITHEQAMRYDSVFKKFAVSSTLIAKQASFLLYNMALYEKTPLRPKEKLAIYPHNGIFSNDRLERTMVLYWGSPAMSPEISGQIKALSHLDPLLETIKEGNPESVACYVVTEPGIVRYYPNIHGVEKLPSTTKFDIRNANWYVIAKPANNPGRKTVWSNIYLDSVGHGLMTTASTPVYSKSGEYLGAAGVDVTLNNIVKDIFEKIPSCHRMEGLFSFLVDNQGRLIAFPPEYMDMFEIKIDRDKLVDATVILKHSLLDSSNLEIRKIGESMLEKNYQVSEFILNGQSYIISSHLMTSTGWRLGVVVPESVILASVQETRDKLDLTVKKITGMFALVTALFLIVSVVVVAILSIKYLIRPLGKLSMGALHVKEGDLTTHVDIQTKDQIGSLAQLFNNMVDTLRQGRDREKAYAENLEQKVKDRTSALESERTQLINAKKELELEVAERLQAEETLSESEEKYRELVENINDVIYSSDENGMVTYISPLIEDVMGYHPSEITGKNFLDFIHPEDIPLVIQKFAEGLSGSLETSEYRLLAKSGEYRWVRSSNRPIYKEESVVGVRGIFVDVTKIKEIEHQLQQAQKMETVGTLAGGVAHEFNNILTIIIGNTELAVGAIPERNPAGEFLKEIQTASLRARDVVRQLLGFARKSVFKLQSVHLIPVIKEAMILIRAFVPVAIEIRQDLLCRSDTVMADTVQINQVLINLCTNAKNAMQEKGGVLEVKLEDTVLDEKSATRYEDLSPGNYVKLTVKDSGHGIDPKIIARIFDPYFTTTSLAEGTGMGLAVAHGIVKHHNGAISVESELGKGTVFEVLFPLTEA